MGVFRTRLILALGIQAGVFRTRMILAPGIQAGVIRSVVIRARVVRAWGIRARRVPVPVSVLAGDPDPVRWTRRSALPDRADTRGQDHFAACSDLRPQAYGRQSRKNGKPEVKAYLRR
ncbi:hypothetical protein Adi01nite_21230 [Amorphoplanes digitatis]|nr:hypothetical protein Adi01nite_21230 [Actinoplanes digitatis]